MQNFNGWLCLDKHAGISSNIAMLKVRNTLNQRVGYVGTLDPFATGVLPIGVGEARKFIRFIEQSKKKYIFTVIFGTLTDTLDKDGKIIETTSKIPNMYEILNVISNFIGDIEQVPPVFSAIKINGKRACDRVRLGENVSLTKKNVKVFSLNVVEENLKEKKATFEATCSCGTYIRSLARDMAEKLGSICYVNELRRIESGFFSIKDAILLENFIKMVDTDRVNDVFVPLEKPLDDIPALYLRIDDITKLQNGLCVVTKTPDVLSSNIKILDDNRGGFYGVGYISDYGRVHPIRMCVRK